VNLILDIGNSYAKVAVFNGDELLTHSRIEDKKSIPAEILSYRPQRALISCVRADVPPELDTHDLMETILFQQDLALPIVCSDTLRRQTGTDRLANAVAISVLSPHATGMVVDCGTCITYTVLINNILLGGAITPGYRTRLNSMHAYTGKLPDLTPEKEFIAFPGSDTHTAMQTGSKWGIIREIEGFVAEFRTAAGIDAPVYITGGDAVYFEDPLKNIIFADAFITLRGLNALLENYDRKS
jgi:type III pantothenate kinase